MKAGAPLPDISTVEAFKRALLAAKSVAYIDPAAGGSSGIYVAKLLERLGIAKEVNAKAELVQGGEVADHIADGEAEIGIHQISEILPVKGVDAGRAAAGGNPEFHGLFGRRRHGGEGCRGGERPGQVPVGAACAADHQGKGHGAGRLIAAGRQAAPAHGRYLAMGSRTDCRD